jgi:RNA polymerase sigma-70 factor (ECF subfamily)
MATDESRIVAEAYRRHGDRIYRFFLRRFGDHHEAEDLAQRVFADAVVGLAKSEPDSEIGWLYAVAERRFVDELRRRRRAASLPPDVGRPLELNYDRAAARAIKRAMVRLEAPARQVVVMKLFEDRSYAEIAEQLGITEAAAKMRLSRALRSLRVLLVDEGIES